MAEFIFYLIATMILFFGFMTVVAQQIFRAAIYLLFTLINIAALYFFLNLEFIAAVQIAVYVGGIVVLILFALFLTHHVDHKLPRYPKYRIVAAAFAGIFGFALCFRSMLEFGFPPVNEKPHEFAVSQMGQILMDMGDGGYILPFEVVSILLLAAMIACITIALQTKQKSNVQPSIQPNIE